MTCRITDHETDHDLSIRAARRTWTLNDSRSDNAHSCPSEALDERGQRAGSVQQQLLRHAGRQRPTSSSTCRCSTSSTSTSGSSAATRRATAEKELPADLSLARSLVPAGTATLRDFSNIAPEIPKYIPENCTGCMDCVTECPDTAILGKVLGESRARSRSSRPIPERPTATMYRAAVVARPRSITTARRRRGWRGGMFNIIIDPSKCKGCAECVTVCDDNALKMIAKTDEVMTNVRKSHRYFKNFGPRNDEVHQRQPAHRHDAQGADAHLHRRGRLVRRLRRGHGPADDVRRHRLEVRRPVGHRRRHRLQHGLHLDLSVQPLPGALDQLAVRERPGRRHRRADALGPDGLGRTSRSGASAATAPCSTSASSRCRACWPAA